MKIMNRYSIIFVIYTLSIVLSFILFVLLFWTTFLNEFTSIFSRAFYLLLSVESVLFLILYKLQKKLNFIDIKDICIILLISFSLNFFLYIEIPFNAARSNSMIMINYFYTNKNRYVDYDNVKDYLKNIYFEEYDATKIRLEEQEKLGLIKKDNNSYKITKKGEKFIFISRFISSLYNLDNNFLLNPSSN